MSTQHADASEESASNNSHRWEVQAALDRALDHPRDDPESLELSLRVRFTSHGSIDSDRLSVTAADVDERRGALRVEIEGSALLSRSQAIRALRSRVLPRYDAETDRDDIPANPGLVGVARRTNEMPRKYDGDLVSDEEWKRARERAAEIDAEPDSAPDLTLQEQTVHVRTLEGDPAPMESAAPEGDHD